MIPNPKNQHMKLVTKYCYMTQPKRVSKKLSYQWLGPFEIIEQTSPVNFRLAGMGRRADIVHSDRLKPYPTPTKNSIRRTQPDEGTPIEHVKNSRKIRTDPTQEDTAELIDKIQTFLDPEQIIGKRKISPVPKPKPPPPP